MSDAPQEFPVQSYALGTSVYAERDGKILLLKRAAGAMSGQWYLPGGALDPGESLEQGAIRELHEESGLEPATPLVLIGLVPMFLYDRELLIVGYACGCKPGDVVISHEHSDFRWVDPREYREQSFAEESVRKLEQANARVGAIVRGIQQDLDRYLEWRAREDELERLRAAAGNA